MKSLLTTPVLLAALFLSGCSSLAVKVPPGSLTSWTHVDNYGPFQSKIVVTDVDKQADGTFVLGHYDGQASWLGFGPHDVITGLHIGAQGVPVVSPSSVTVAPAAAK